MARLLWTTLALSLLAGLSAASPIDDPQVRDFLSSRDSSLRPLHLGKRDADGFKPRHLRSEEDIPLAKRDVTPPDLGQIATFNGDPQPIRGALGATFLGPSNHELDRQNVDNVAAPTTDAGMRSSALRHCMCLMLL